MPRKLLLLLLLLLQKKEQTCNSSKTYIYGMLGKQQCEINLVHSSFFVVWSFLLGTYLLPTYLLIWMFF
jgi:hypothetical protein